MKRYKEFALAVGVALWVWLVWRTGPAILLQSLQHVGWGMISLLAIAAARHAIRSVACRWAMGADRSSFSFPEMYAILLISEAIKFLALAGLVLGESAKGLLLSQRVSAARAVSSVVLDVVLYQLSAMLFFLAGAFWLVWRGPIDAELRKAIWIAVVIMGAATVLLTAGFARRWRTTQRILAKLRGARGRLLVLGRWLSKREEKVAEVSAQASDFYHHHARLFYGILLFNLLAHCASALEVWVALYLLGQPLGYGAAVSVEALTKLVRITGAVVPANIGVFEGGTALILAALGIPAAVGVALGIVRQVRSLLWAAAGLLVLPLWPGPGVPPRS